MALRKVVVIAGPTASGKSQLAVDVARSCRGVVVNADSMQVYPIRRSCRQFRPPPREAG